MNPTSSLSLAWLRGALAMVAFVVVAEAALGFAGLTAAAPPLIAFALLAAGVAAAQRGWRALRAPAAETTALRATAADAGAALALVVALASRLTEGLHHAGGAFTYDVLSYHLHLPASWWAAGRVGIVPTPFGDQAPAYAPANAELTYLFALASTGNLRLAHAGQAAYAALAALAIVATARQGGASRPGAVGAALAFLMIPEVWQQASGAMADLALASFLLAGLPFLWRLWCRDRTRDGRDVLALGAALGLAVGTKYVGALLAVPLLAATAWLLARNATLAGWSRWRATGAIAGLAFACGGFWYARNALLTGDPTFPVTLRLGGLTIAPGLYGGAEMRRWLYHLPVTDLQPFLEMFAETGWGFLACLAIALPSLLFRRRPWAPALFASYVALGWLVVPYQQSRFLFAAWGVAALTPALAAPAGRPALRELAFAPAIAGAAWQYPTPARLLTAALWTGAAVLAAREARSPRPPGRWSRAAPWLGLPTTAVLVLALIAWTRPYSHADPQPARVGDGHDAGWQYVAARLHGRRIAYAGSNLPLPLWGWHLENRGRYVNVAGKLSDVLHDFRDGPGHTDTAEPAPERARPDRAAWLANLTAAGTDALFVTRLYPEVAAGMPHDAEGFPSERAWADALPDRFPLIFATPDVRIYDVRPDAGQGHRWPVEASPPAATP